MPAPPNLLVFFSDQQRFDTLGLQHPGQPSLTPNLDRMARQGTYFPHAVTPQPVCGPARSCLQTGQYATTTGVWKNGPGLRADSPKLAELLREAGYHTSYLGKWHLSEGTGEGAVPLENRGGYEDWLAANCVELVSGPWSARLWDKDNQEKTFPGYRVDAVADEMIRQLDRFAKQDKPFLLFCSFLEPHHQNTSDNYPAPHGYAEAYETFPLPADLRALGGSSPAHWAGYCGMVKRLDEALGRTLDALETLGLADNTVVVYISDHGCHFKTRNGEYKRSPHESSVRVPFVFRGPGWNSGGERTECASLVDLMPSLLDTAGVAIPAAVQGRSLLPLVCNDIRDVETESLIQFGDGWLPPGRALRSPRWKYAVTADDTHAGHPDAPEYHETHLYDLMNDPYELTNLVDIINYEDVRIALRERLLARMAAIGEPPAKILPSEKPRPGGQRTIEYP